MRRGVQGAIVGVLATASLVAATMHASSTGGEATPRAKLTLIAPAAPGGGWDAFAREAQQVLRTDGIVGAPQVVNVPGASGTIGLGQVAEMDGRHDVLLVTGGVMVGGIVVNDTAVGLDDVTPIARLADDFNVLVVPADSPFETLDDLVEALVEDPGGTSFAGGSLGGIDHLLAGMLASESGVDPSDVNYLAYPGGGEVVTSMLSQTASAGLSGYNEFRDQIDSGNLRALALSAPEPIEGIDVPSFVEQGYDVEMANWRGLVAAPGISPEVEEELEAIVLELHATDAWREVLDRNSWEDSLMMGDELEAFLAEETERTERIVSELGL